MTHTGADPVQPRGRVRHARRALDAVLAVIAWVACLVLGVADATAQPAARLPRVGVLYIGAPSDASGTGLLRGLHDLGYVEGRNIDLDFRYAGGRPELLPELARELVQSKIDVIVTGGPGPFQAVRQASATVPIVTVGGSDPVAEGWAKTLARPGGQATGFTVTFPGIGAKQLELLKEALPQLVRVGLVMDPDEMQLPRFVEGMQESGRQLGLQVEVLEVRRTEDFEAAFRLAREHRLQAIVGIETTFVLQNRQVVAGLAARERIPLVGEFAVAGTEGLLMAYGADLNELHWRAAGYVDRILKGARPGDLPIERPAKLDLVVNRKAARALGITLPQAVLLRANRVVE